ncbi:type I-E CRISPR-associated protein Cse1/CasA [Actinophytocola sp.]|uniref:type I-E CRISPR-associated protein Cse1/CasA n=1 Tax=Actinophytocola sp. TaxID=1872138 RepID=UPI003D6AF0A9
MSDPSTRPLSFNLIEQPWLLVRDRDGRVSELSVVDMFRRSHELAGLVGDVPTQVFALTRMLLAVLHGALCPRSVADWEALWDADQLPVSDIASYLDRHRSRFDLVHPTTPFMQVAGLRTEKGELSDPSKLIADVPNGHRFFTTRLGTGLSLSFAEAARWLVHCHAFDPSGIKSGAVGDPRVKNGKGYPIGVAWSGLLGGILPEGRTLRETLLLNLIPRDFGDVAGDVVADVPVWEREPLGPAEQPPEGLIPAGPVTLFTWQSRRVRLHVAHGRVTGVLICNGDALMPQNMHTTETHTAWRRSEPQQKKLRLPVAYMPLEHNVERVIWRGLAAMLPDRARRQGSEAASRVSAMVSEWLGLLSTEGVLARDYPLRMRTIGMTYGGQSSTTEEIVDDALSLQAILVAQDAAALKGAALDSVEAAENAARALGFLAADLARASGGDPDGPRTRAIESAYAALDPMFRDWLAALGPDTDPDDCQVVWHRQADGAVRTLGADLVAAASPTAWVGRKHNERLYTSSHAVARFHSELRRVLPYAHQEAA